jgi:hypothetical protein
MQLKSIIAALAAMTAGLPAAYCAEDDARAAQVMWNAWLCSIYAELKGDADEQGRLFTLGYSKGKQFIDAAAAGTITPDEGRTIVPMAVGMLMAGPSQEFVLGRIFESAAGRAFDHVATEDADGMPLAPADYIVDDELKASIATTKYMGSNCELIR